MLIDRPLPRDVPNKIVQSRGAQTPEHGPHFRIYNSLRLI